MRFTIEADIPDGYEPTGEYRLPRAGEFYLTSNEETKAAMDLSAPWLILREKPLAYEDFAEREGVGIGRDGLIYSPCRVNAVSSARRLADALIAAADHVDRVNKQKDGAS
jgi:hypothetical protein